MKYYLIAILLIIMAAGGRTMFEIAHHALGREHDSLAPGADTMRLIFLALWFVAMMMATVILLRNKDMKHRNIFIALLSAGVFVPVIYQFISN